MSKKSAFMSAYAAMAGSSLPRKEMLDRLSKKVGISTACASTYMSNVATGRWDPSAPSKVKNAVAKKAKATLTAAAVAAMSNSELVAKYNAKAEKPVKKFRDHATAVARVNKLYGITA